VSRLDDSFDLVIVGGRPAGASLAARLGAAGARVLVCDKASFPSRPPVSAPFLLPHAIALLDELGLDEREWAAGTPVMREFVLEFSTYFRARFHFDQPVGGHSHFYAIDRARFDHCLWRNLKRYENVTAIENARVRGIVRDEDGRVAGVELSIPGEEEPRRARAKAVVGADGRHSLVAREVGAKVTSERRDVDTTPYYAHWQEVAPYDEGEPVAHIHTSCDGFSFAFMPSADGEVMVVAQGQRALYAALEGSPEEVYEGLLRARPLVWRRLAGARRVSELSGMKRIPNLFREHGGPGWALVGDAYHQKDSLDAQGIYDALLSAKLLAEELVAWHAGERSWDRAIANYGRRVEAELAPMFAATMDRVQREIYDIPPPAVAKTMLRWVLTHPDYGHRFTALVTRQLEPAEFLPPPVLLKIAAKGALARVRAKLRPGPDPTDPLEVPVGVGG
jgi:2-polyprenyl-6-methoxyphenol hydroxylase-like FAD-dependent oxidoreductase